MRKNSWSRNLFLVIDVIILMLFVLVCVYPLIYVIFASLSNSGALMAHEGLLLRPVGFNTAAYEAVVKNPNILNGYKNTIFILVVGVIINLFMTSIAAYVLSRKNLMWKKVILWLMLFTMYFSGGLVPSYLLIQKIGLYDSIWSLILPGAISTYNMIILRTAFVAVPESLEEAAFLDGATHLQILWHVILPLTKATMAVMVLYYGVGYWNSWFNASIYLQDKTRYPLQLVLKEILISNDTASMSGDMGASGSANIDSQSIGESIKYAVVVVATLPILCIYPLLQKYFVKGVMIGAVKG